MTLEIPAKNWSLFCDRINAQAHDSISIRLNNPDGKIQAVADKVPLVNTLFQTQTGACSNLLMIATGGPDKHPAQHEVFEPIRLVLKKNAAGSRFNQLEILATEVQFRPGINPALLEDLGM